jgi:NDP-sugar pyrophosphorylase family protein
MINIIIPAAGSGQRFVDAGYDKPKPLIEVAGLPMLEQVIRNIIPKSPSKFIIIHRLDADTWENDVHVWLKLDKPTRGALDTLMYAIKYVPESEGLLLANCDQLVDFDVDDFIKSAKDKDGALVTFKSNKPHHSYVKTNDKGIITSIVEKEVISNQAVTGVYYFKHAADFFIAAEQVIASDLRTKGEFYVSSAIDLMVKDGYKLGIYEAPSAMLGTPEELQLFEAALKVAKRL